MSNEGVKIALYSLELSETDLIFLADLVPDPNDPGLMVCEADRDEFDPYRLAPREPDQIVLPFVRPDTNINTHPAGVIQEAGDEFITTEDGNKYLEMD